MITQQTERPARGQLAAQDPNELRNLYGDARQAGRVKELRAEIERLRKETGDV